MSKLKIVITRGPNKYGAYVEGKGIYAQGEDIKKVRKDVLSAIEFYKENVKEIFPEMEENYEIEYHFDTPSFLKYFTDTFSKAALERMTGINQKLLGHYASGLKKPGAMQAKRIDDAIKKIAEELRQIHITT